MRVVTLPGVFKPRSDTWLLAAHVAAEPLPLGARVLDVCTGSGAIAVAAARRPGLDVTALDVSRRAAVTAWTNARLNGESIQVRTGDLLAPVAGRTFHLISSNPPYLPSSDERPRRGAARAWEAGPRGRLFLDRILDEAPPLLVPGGVLLLVHSHVCGEEDTLERMRAAGLEAEVRARHAGSVGPLLAQRAPGLREEEMLVLRGRRPADQPVRVLSVTGTPKRRSASPTTPSSR